MDIYLNEVENKSSSFTFPVLPEKIKTKFGTNYQRQKEMRCCAGNGQHLLNV